MKSGHGSLTQRFTVGDSRSSDIFLSVYIRGLIVKMSKMPKLGKKQLANKLNGKKGGYHGNFATRSQDDLSDETDNNNSDEDFVYGSQPRHYDNSSSSFIMTILMLQTVVNAASCCDKTYRIKYCIKNGSIKIPYFT